jgi:two-component system phosphate regulon sensor histidine kinase PhoR
VAWLLVVSVAALAIIDGLAVLTLSSLFVPDASRSTLWVSGLGIAVAIAGVAAMLATSLRRKWFEPLTRLARSLDADTLPQSSGHQIPELTALESSIRRFHGRMVATVDQGRRDHTELVAIFNHMADGLLVLSSDERVVLSNPASAWLLGRQDLLGRPLAEVARDPDLIQIARAATDGPPVSQVVELWPEAGGPRRWLQVVATRLPTGHRRLVLLQNVTELRHAEAARRDFVANVSHELRTPVASLTALVETLEGGASEDPSARTEFLRRMHIEVDRLAHLVAELLQLARVEAGRIELEIEAHGADDLVREAVERIQPYAQRVGVNVELDPRHGAGLLVRADSRRVAQVLANLLNNAVKFTPPGGQIIVGADEADDFVELWVADSGIGIEPDQLLRIFERFYKVDAARASRGTGLGLAICKHLVQAHGGRIWAESAGPGRGATFRFTLPTALATAPLPRVSVAAR